MAENSNLEEHDKELVRDRCIHMIHRAQYYCIFYVACFFVLMILGDIFIVKFWPIIIFPLLFTIGILIFALRWYILRKVCHVIKNGNITTGMSYYHNELPGEIVDEWTFTDEHSEKEEDILFKYKANKHYLGYVSQSSSRSLPKLIIKHDEVYLFWMFGKSYFIPNVLQVFAFYPQYRTLTKLKITRQYANIFEDKEHLEANYRELQKYNQADLETES